MDFQPPYALIILLVIGLAIFQFYRHREKVRGEALQELARGQGWQFDAECKAGMPGEWTQFELFKRGRGAARNFSNGITGQRSGTAFTLIEYKYRINRGNHSRTVRQSVLCVHIQGLGLPAFELRPETLGHKIGSVFGYSDIDFDSSPGFSSNYLLRGKNESRVRKLFDSRLRKFFESDLKWSIEGEGDRIILYRAENRCDPDQVIGFIDEAIGVVSRFTGDVG